MRPLAAREADSALSKARRPVRIQILELLTGVPRQVRELRTVAEVEASPLPHRLMVLRRTGRLTGASGTGGGLDASDQQRGALSTDC